MPLRILSPGPKPLRHKEVSILHLCPCFLAASSLAKYFLFNFCKLLFNYNIFANNIIYNYIVYTLRNET